MSARRIAPSALACALLLGCGIGETISLGATAGAPATGGAGAGAGAGGSADTPSAGSGGMLATLDAGDLPALDAGDAGCSDPLRCPPDAGDDAGPLPACMPQRTSLVTACAHTPSAAAAPLELSLHFEWPQPDVAREALQVITSGMPLVGPFTDDDGNGVIDACDIPDVLVPVMFDSGPTVFVLLSGDRGEELWRSTVEIAPNVAPALADLDGDGSIEIAAQSPDGQLLILDHEGLLERVAEVPTLAPFVSGVCQAVAIHDLEGDSVPEILSGFDVYESDGTRRFGYQGSGSLEPEPGSCIAPMASDLDGDGVLEVIFGNAAVYDTSGAARLALGPLGATRLASFAATPRPELMVASASGLTLMEELSDAWSIGYEDVCMSPAVRIADVDQDGWLDVVSPTCGLTAFELLPDRMMLRWQDPLPGVGTGALALFDLRGRGIADVIHASPSGLFVHDGSTGEVLVQHIEFAASPGPLGPVVADVDNDGSADILLMSDGPQYPRVVAVRAAQRDFAAARRIYSQYANQVTRIDENGSVQPRPTTFFPSHSTAHVENGHLCVPATH